MINFLHRLLGRNTRKFSQTEIDRRDQLTSSLALYHFPGCFFCLRVRRVIHQLDLNIELRNIHSNDIHYKTLVSCGGKSTVPCLKITDINNQQKWLYESSDIIQYLKELDQSVSA